MRPRFDAICVPGARVHADGSLSGAFERRIARAAQRWHEGQARVIVVSGRGQGGRTEGAAGLARLVELGVPEDALVLEQRARNTRENAERCAELVDGALLVVTCDFHVRRCRLLFSKHYDEVSVEGVVGPRWLRPRLREAVSLARAWMGA